MENKSEAWNKFMGTIRQEGWVSFNIAATANMPNL